MAKGKSGLWENYEKGKLQSKSCPKCGHGFLLAEHKDRLTCGKCGYSEYKDKKSAKSMDMPAKQIDDKAKLEIKDEFFDETE
jgi:small subunit ribosomal protein S27Ae